ncbi:MAG TPA: putative baseplate assembly protein [Pyrinomonadaceae bacterium]|nr:putative baseplate assembly protein [Pyrinomonadaceae bacterium]
MPILPPALDDRSFDDLVEEVLARIPPHTPEWTNPRVGDPGRTLIELFAWLTDTLLYRANLIPERQRLAFLRLLGVKMRPAAPARGLVSVLFDDDKATEAINLRPFAQLKGPVNFETRNELTVLPVAAEAYYKRPPSEEELTNVADLLQGLQRIYGLNDATGRRRQQARPYVTTPIFVGGASASGGFDLVADTIDQSLWIALLTIKEEPEPGDVEQARKTLGANKSGGQQLINIGYMPAIEVPALFENVGPRARIPHVWEMSTGREIRGEPEYLTLDSIADADTTEGLARRGVMRLVLPAPDLIGAPSNDVRANLRAGVGDRPPRLDDPAKAARLITWLRLRPTLRMSNMPVSWVGVNAVEIDQRQSISNRVVGVGDGTGDQEFQLPGQSVDPDTLLLQVEKPGVGYQQWFRVDDLALAGRDHSVFSLDGEAGTIRFGNGVRGSVPENSARVRVAYMRAGGGLAGNLPAGSLAKITARDLTGAPVTQKLKVQQSLVTDGGEDAETLLEAEQRIPALFRHRDRAVTEQDYQRLAGDTPGVRMGRVDVLPRFKPQQRREQVPGVVSVMVLPFKETRLPPNPSPDRYFIESVFNYLDARRPLATELYVIGCEYVPLGLSVAITVRHGFGQNQVINEVRDALRAFLWPLAPGGIEGAGWQRGRAVRDREVEVMVARVAGVDQVNGINFFERREDEWEMIRRAQPCAPVELPLKLWQLPELLTVIVVASESAPEDLRAAPNPFADGQQGGAGGSGTGGGAGSMAVPVVPEVC